MPNTSVEGSLKKVRIPGGRNPRVSVVVCTYNRADLLVESLKTLEKQNMDSSLYEVLIINNNSTDNTQEQAGEYVKRNSNFRIFLETEQGLSQARNRGWKEARGEYVAFMDDDAKAAPDWCEKILHAFETVEPKPTAVGGKILPWYKCVPPAWFSDELEIRSWGEHAGFLQPPRRDCGFSGSNMAFPKSILEKLDGFSTGFGMIGSKMRLGDETDLFLRIESDEKLFWYDPAIVVSHFTPHKNMKVHYYIKRSYLAGEVVSLTENKNVIRAARRLLFNIIKFLVSIPIFFIKSVDFKKTFLLKGRDLAWDFGFFVGSLKKVT